MGFNNQQNWRLRVGRQMFRAAHALEFFSVGIMRPEDFVASTRRFYADPTQVAILVKNSVDGLYPAEATLLERMPSSVGTALVLGCGAGREAIALARRGWQIVGIDNVPALIDAAKVNAAQAGLPIKFHCHDILQGIPVDRSFDLICLFGLFYSSIPTRKWRVRLLAACRQHLQPDGRCLLNFLPGEMPFQRKDLAQRWRKGLAWVVRGNRECQLGDFWSNGTLFLHRFAAVSELTEEAAEAGLRVERGFDEIPEDMAILRPATTAPQKVTESMTVGVPSGRQ